MPNVGHSAVSGDDARVFGQDEQFGADIMDEVGVVAAREVGSAYGFVKQYVARDEQPCFGAVKNDVAGRVAGDVQDLEGVAADLERFAFGQPAGRLKRGGNGKTVLGGRFGQGLQQEFVVCMRTDDGDGTVFAQCHHAAGMVEMAVGQPNGGQGEVFRVQLLQEEGNVAADIGQDGFAGFVIPQKGAVLAERGNGNDFGLKCHEAGFLG